MIYVAPQSPLFDAHRSLYMFKYKVCEPRDQNLKKVSDTCEIFKQQPTKKTVTNCTSPSQHLTNAVRNTG